MGREPGVVQQAIMVVGGVGVALAGVALGVAIAFRITESRESVPSTPVPIVQPPVASPSPASSPSPEPTEATPTATPDAPSPTATPTASPTATPPSPTPSPTPTPTRTPSPSPTPTPTRTPTPTPTPTPPGSLQLPQTNFALPGEGTALGQAGWFPGQARTVTVRDGAGATVAYVYWFRWAGDAYDVGRGGGTDSIYPNVRILVADAANPRPAFGSEVAITFAASEAAAGVSRSAVDGRFSFTVTLTNAVQTSFNGGTYVWGSDLAATVTVSVR